MSTRRCIPAVLVCAFALVAVLFVLAGGYAGEATAPSPAAEPAPAPVAAEPVKLPAPSTEGGMTLTQALATRRSVRGMVDEPLADAEVSQILWAAQGITEPTRGLRTAPSAGARYPLTVYAIKADGVFKYVPVGHALLKVKDGDQRKAVVGVTGQDWNASAPLILVIVSVDSRTSRYGARSRTFNDFEAGAAAENVFLQATALGLGSCAVGAFGEDALKPVVGLSPDERPVIIIPIGKPAPRQ